MRFGGEGGGRPVPFGRTSRVFFVTGPGQNFRGPLLKFARDTSSGRGMWLTRTHIISVSDDLTLYKVFASDTYNVRYYIGKYRFSVGWSVNFL